MFGNFWECNSGQTSSAQKLAYGSQTVCPTAALRFVLGDCMLTNNHLVHSWLSTYEYTLYPLGDCLLYSLIVQGRLTNPPSSSTPPSSSSDTLRSSYSAISHMLCPESEIIPFLYPQPSAVSHPDRHTPDPKNKQTYLQPPSQIPCPEKPQ